MKDSPLRIALLQHFTDEEWLGGANVYGRVAEALRASGEAEILWLRGSPSGGDSGFEELVFPALSSAALWSAELVPHPLPGLATELRRRRVDLLFGNCLLGAGEIPTIAWVPDLQHRRLAHFFGRCRRMFRDRAYANRCRLAARLLATSESVRADLEEFAPSARDKTLVLGPPPRVPPEDLPSPEELRGRYGLPERFLFLPNHFWLHKNHDTVIRALGRLTKSDRPVVVCTGNKEDPRRPAHRIQLEDLARREGVSGQFRILGVVPYSDVLGLFAACGGVLNPSRFEGFALSVQEGKLFERPLLLSDIPVHRQAAPGARFFGVDDAEGLAEMLRHPEAAPLLAADSLSRIREVARREQSAFARAFLAAARECLR